MAPTTTRRVRRLASDGHWVYALAPGEDASAAAQQWTSYPDCSGHQQSPIDIQSDITQTPVVPALDDGLRPAYLPAHAKFWNTGHSFQAFEGGVDPSRGRLHVRGRAYDFEQLHFHVPSENLLDGRRYAMEAHLVHSSGSSLAVLAILFEVGACNAFLDKFWERFPDDGTTGAEGAAKGVLDVGEWLTDATLAEYYHWTGSLTTPPCTEGVDWQLLKRVEPVCERQLERLRSGLAGSQHGVTVNNRVVQPTNGRIVSQTTPAATAADARADGSPASDAVAAAGWVVATNFGQLVGDAILLFTVVILMYGAARYVARRVDDSRRRRMRMAEMAETPSETLSDAEDYM